MGMKYYRLLVCSLCVREWLVASPLPIQLIFPLTVYTRCTHFTAKCVSRTTGKEVLDVKFWTLMSEPLDWHTPDLYWLAINYFRSSTTYRVWNNDIISLKMIVSKIMPGVVNWISNFNWQRSPKCKSSERELFKYTCEIHESCMHSSLFLNRV